MKAMILAAGRGKRMRPLTDATPKPLLCAGGKPLIAWHLEKLAKAGFAEVVVNCGHLGAQLPAALGDGRRFGLSIAYSMEPEDALETAGGIAHALPLLGDKPFLAMNGDIFCDFDPAAALDVELGKDLAHLWLAENPPHHPQGDFALAGGRLRRPAPGEAALTYSGIGVYSPALFAGLDPGRAAPLAPLLFAAAGKGRLSGERLDGCWEDIGTPGRLAALDARLMAGS